MSRWRSRGRPVAIALGVVALALFVLAAVGLLAAPVGSAAGAAALGAAAVVYVGTRRPTGTMRAVQAPPAIASPLGASTDQPARVAPLTQADAAPVAPRAEAALQAKAPADASIIDLRDRPAASTADPMIRRIAAGAQPAAPKPAAAAATPVVELTPAGLERRRPSTPAPKGPDEGRAEPGEAPVRSAAEVRSMLSRYRSGVAAGRDKLDKPDGRPQP